MVQSAKMYRRPLLALPALAVGIVLWAVLTAGWPQAVDVARVVGGPTRGNSTLSWQLSVGQLEDGQRSPSPRRALRLTLQAGAQSAEWRGESDAAGLVEARLELAQPLDGAAWVRVEAADTGAVLAEGNVALGAEPWRAGARRQGGWLPGRQQGEPWLRVAPAEGTLAVPFATELVIEATRGRPLGAATDGLMSGDQPAAGVPLELELVGAELTRAAPERLKTDAAGRARIGIRPLEHAIRLQLRAYAAPASGNAGAPVAEWYGSLPVTPGALHASQEGTRLAVSSPIPRDSAYVSLVDEQARLAGYALQLQPDAAGGASVSLELDAAVIARSQVAPVYAVVSSEPDKRSASAVGWPLRAAAGTEPASSFDVADQLLLDGTAGVLERERARRLTRRWLAALLLALVGALLLIAFTREVSRNARPLPQPSDGSSGALLLASQRWWIGLAVVCMLLGVGALAYFGLLQR